MIEVHGQTLLARMIELLAPRVPRLHLVVGYREELVIDFCARHFPQVVIARNTEYRSTNTAESYGIGARNLTGKTLFLDGDLIIAPDSMDRFLAKAALNDILLGLTHPASENAVFAQGSQDASGPLVHGFSRDVASDYEWANIVAGPAQLMDEAQGYVFEQLTPSLPLPGEMLDLAEVDTAADLAAAEQFVSRHDL
jgi:hypothetical protein